MLKASSQAPFPRCVERLCKSPPPHRCVERLFTSPEAPLHRVKAFLNRDIEKSMSPRQKWLLRGTWIFAKMIHFPLFVKVISKQEFYLNISAVGIGAT